jgi:hypothetical protein
MDEFDCQINFNSLKKYTTSLLATIAIMDKSDQLQQPQEIYDFAVSSNSYYGRVRSSDQLQQPQEICDLAVSDDRSIGLSFRTLYKK